jgi:hypothetical protein
MSSGKKCKKSKLQALQLANTTTLEIRSSEVNIINEISGAISDVQRKTIPPNFPLFPPGTEVAK